MHPAKSDGSKMPVSVRHGSPDIQPATFPDTYQSGAWAGSPHPQAGQPNPDGGQHGWGWGRIATGAMPRLTVQQVMGVIRSGRADGIGVFGGLASGGLEMVEAEGRARALLPKVREAAERLGVLHLLERLAAGCVEESPSGGVHFVLRVTDGPALGNTVLAARPDQSAEHGRLVLFETRGQGGWFVCAPSAGRTHRSGKPYRIIRGGPSTIPGFTTAERDALYAAFRAVDEMPAPVPAAPAPASVQRRERPAGDILPGEDFNQRASWEEILTGWKRGQVVGERQHWTRPGKPHGTSATTTADVLCCYSSSAGLPVFTGAGCKNALSKFATYAHLHHAGDFAAAARDLWARGYGSRNQDDGQDDGQPDAPPEPRPSPAGECRSLDDWRRETASRRAEVIGQPGLHLDRSPTGAGKTYATISALARASSSLTVLPTHANVEERVAEMQQQGIDAVAFPELTADNCRQFDAARKARAFGLAVGAAVCPGCPFNRIRNPQYPGRDEDGKPEPKTVPGPCHDADQYQGLMAAAYAAAHRVGTHERLRRSEQAADGVQVVVVDEMPESVLAPTLTVTAAQLGPVDFLAHGICNFWYSRADADQKAFAGAMQQVVAAIHAECQGITTAGTRNVDLHSFGRVPRNWQRLLMESIQQVGAARDLDPDALALVTRAAAGELTRLTIVTDLTRRGRLVHFVVGSWQPAIPKGASVVLLDATADAGDVAAAVQGTVNDCTPAGHLPLVRTVVQIPDDISRGTSAATVAGHIEAFLAAHPEVQRLGIIGHKPHLSALMVDGELAGAARERVSKWCWFGQGPDRASNTWHDECDHLLVLGTPRANPGDYRRWLAQHGLHEAAGRAENWGPRNWESVGVDGQPVTVQGMGYRDPDWHRAFVAVCRSTLHQSVGRGRAILPNGIPVTLLTAEPTPYPIAPSLVTQPAAARETADIIRRMGTQSGLLDCAKTPIGNPYSGNCASGPWRTADCIRAICTAAGIDRRAAEVRLADARRRGLLVSPRRGWWGLPGTPAATAPTPAPAAHQVVDQVPAPAPVARPSAARPTVQGVVISTAAPPAAPTVVDVAAEPAPAATTATCTSTVTTTAFDDLTALVDERAAILEADAGLDRETADRLAREMILGRDAPPALAPAPRDAGILVGVDTPSLAARATPYVRQVLGRFSGTVRLVDDRDDPFAAARRRAAPATDGRCRCGADDWVQVSIHGGRSTRVDCRNCDRFGRFTTWHGRRLPQPGDPPDGHAQPAGAGPVAVLPLPPPAAKSAVGDTVSFAPAAAGC